MKKRFLLAALLVSSIIHLKAQQNYDASLIPKELLPYASSIVRDQQKTLEVRSLDNVIITVKRTVTVLNENGDDNVDIKIYYDKSDVVKNIKGIVSKKKCLCVFFDHRAELGGELGFGF